MGRKKFNKKDAAVYHLVRRSQRDVGGYINDKGQPIDMPSDFVLIPSHDTLKKAELNKKKEEHEHQQQQQQQQQEYHHQEKEDHDHSADDALMRAKQRLELANLVDDYDYEQHMKPISGQGVFISNNNDNNNNNNSKASMDYYSHEIRSKNLNLIDPMINEVERQLDSIALTADCMDDDIAHALFDDYEDGEYEEILDDFCITANQLDPIENINEYGGSGDGSGGGRGGGLSGLHGLPDGFDFDGHIDRLIAKAKLEENGGSKVIPKNHDAWTQQQNMFKGMKPHKSKKRTSSDHDHDDDDLDSIDEEEEYDDYKDDDQDTFDREFGGGTGGMGNHLDYFTAEENPGIVPKLNPEEEKALCDKFEQTLLEYDSDEVGDLDDECYDIKGDRPLEGDRQLEAALDQFLQDKKDENFVMGVTTEKRIGGSSRVLVNKKLVPYNAIDQVEGEMDEDDEEKVEDVLAEADEVLANPEVDLPPEEILIDGKSYFTMKERNPWDCESILSTYSNLDNNPAIVGRSSRRRNKKKGRNTLGGRGIEDESIAEENPVQILLSNKTGLPLGVLPGPKGLSDDAFGQDTFVSVNKGEARKKDETKEEKKARKLLVKQERQVARIQKKMMREAIQEEFGQRVRNDVSNDVGGKSVFKY